MLGRTLGQYRITRQVGSGGMGVVYVGEHQRLGHTVAIKVVNPELSKNQEIIERFFAEAVAATRIKHSGIIQIFDYGEDAESGSAYFVMELLEGESLGKRMERGSLTLREITNYGRMIADTLGAAHAAGIVHRDLKPDNVFLVPDRMVPGGVRVKVLDFGVAKLAADNLKSGAKTKTGHMLGTPFYMAPEQARGAGEVDQRSDVYSLGCVLFEMATGRVPFPGEGLGEVLGAHQHVQPPEPRSIHPQIDPGLEALILRMLAKAPEERPQSMEQAVSELEQVAGHSLPAGTPSPGLLATARPDSQPPPAATGEALGKQSTMRAASGERPATVPASSGRRIWLAVAILAGLGAIGASVGIAVVGEGGESQASQPPASAEADAGASEPEPEPEPEADNRWIQIAPPDGEVRLGLPEDAGDGAVGFRAALGVTAPGEPFEIQEHEVTWKELEPWLGDREIVRPDWLPESAEERADLPATGIPWEVASDYCKSIGGRLPTEEEWEYAARGAGLRPYPWGDRRLDLERTHVYAGEDARVAEAASHRQDRTPEGVYGLLGNAQEWTADLWRPPRPDQDDSWVQGGGMSFRAVRGLPLAKKPPRPLPAYGAAYREPLCTRGDCYEDAKKIMDAVGFRCVR